jgi:hypothetical protein
MKIIIHPYVRKVVEVFSLVGLLCATLSYLFRPSWIAAMTSIHIPEQQE